MPQQVKNGNYEIKNERGELASSETVFTAHGRQWVHIHGQDRPLGEYLDMGYTFTPLVAMTPERIAALEILLDPDFADADQQAGAHVTVLAMLPRSRGLTA